MDEPAQLDAMIELFGRLGIDVRKEHLGGTGGGLCSVHNRREAFIDLDADLASQVHRCLNVLADLPELDAVYISPALRDLIERARDAELSP